MFRRIWTAALTVLLALRGLIPATAGEKDTKVAQRKAASQLIAAALKEMPLISPPRALPCTWIAEAQVRSGDVAGARTTLEEAKAEAHKIGDGDARAWACGEISRVLAKAGDAAGARQSIEEAKVAADKINNHNYDERA